MELRTPSAIVGIVCALVFALVVRHYWHPVYVFRNLGPEHGSPSVFICMNFDTDGGYERYTVELNRTYADMHGYPFRVVRGYDHLPPWWRKVFIVRDLLDADEGPEYVMWIDADAAFVANRSIPVGRLLRRHGTDFLVSSDAPMTDGPNAGVFAARRTAEGRRMMAEWANSYDSTRWCPTAAPSCDLPNRYGPWRTDSRYAGDTFEQGSLASIVKRWKYTLLDPVLFSMDLDSGQMFVQHLASRDDRMRALYFRTANRVAALERRANVPVLGVPSMWPKGSMTTCFFDLWFKILRLIRPARGSG